MAEQLFPLSACDVGVSVVHDCCQTWLIPLQRLPQTWHTICGPASTPKHLIYTERGLHSIPRMKTRLMAEWLLGIGWIYIDRLMDAQLHMVVERHDPCPKMNSVTLHILNDWTFIHTNISLIHWERVVLSQLSLKKGPPLIHMEWCVLGWMAEWLWGWVARMLA